MFFPIYFVESKSCKKKWKKLVLRLGPNDSWKKLMPIRKSWGVFTKNDYVSVFSIYPLTNISYMGTVWCLTLVYSFDFQWMQYSIGVRVAQYFGERDRKTEENACACVSLCHLFARFPARSGFCPRLYLLSIPKGDRDACWLPCRRILLIQFRRCLQGDGFLRLLLHFRLRTRLPYSVCSPLFQS